MSPKADKAKIRDQIDENLKRIYDEITKEVVPDRFRVLLEQLRKKSSDDQGESG